MAIAELKEKFGIETTENQENLNLNPDMFPEIPTSLIDLVNRKLVLKPREIKLAYAAYAMLHAQGIFPETLGGCGVSKKEKKDFREIVLADENSDLWDDIIELGAELILNPQNPGIQDSKPHKKSPNDSHIIDQKRFFRTKNGGIAFIPKKIPSHSQK